MGIKGFRSFCITAYKGFRAFLGLLAGVCLCSFRLGASTWITPPCRNLGLCWLVLGFRGFGFRHLGFWAWGLNPSPRHLYPKPEAISGTGFRNKLM